MFTLIYYLQTKGQDQLYGHIKMGITLELDCGLVVDFEPDFELPTNHSDKTKVQWQFSNNRNTESLASVLSELEAQTSIHDADISLANLRLLYGYNT